MIGVHKSMQKFVLLIIAVLFLLSLALPWWPSTLEPESAPEEPAGISLNVPEVEIHTSVPAFSDINDVRTRKQLFFEFLMPAVKAENIRISQQRRHLLELANLIQNGQSLEPHEQRWLRHLATEYEVDTEDNSLTDVLVLLKRRVDTVPETLVLVQAANESGWGTSRFAQEGLNFFGQWCFRKGCGLVPDARDEDGDHEVAKFDSVNQSVRSYLNNINTHPAYLELRQIRENYREDGNELTALSLTAGLLSYSIRREAYVEELNAMIRVNRPLIREISSVTLEPTP